jgi:hypothetical protein
MIVLTVCFTRSEGTLSWMVWTVDCNIGFDPTPMEMLGVATFGRSHADNLNRCSSRLRRFYTFRLLSALVRQDERDTIE